MGAFIEGMRMGQQAMQLGIQNRRQAELDERQRVVWEREDKKYGDEQAKQSQVEEQLSNLGKLNASGAVGSGLSLPRAEFSAQPQEGVGFSAPAGMGRGLSVADGATAIDAPVIEAAGRPARESDREAIYGNVARIKGDLVGMRASDAAMKLNRYDEAFADAKQEWRSMSDEQREKLIEQASYDRAIRGFGNYVPGKGKTAGYLNYMPPGADPVRLSAAETEDVYAIQKAMSIDPSRGRAELEKASDKVRAVLEQQFRSETSGVGINNAVTRYANQDANESARLSIASRAENNAAAGLSQPIGATQDGRGLIMFDRRTGETRVVPAPQGVDFRELFPRVTGEKAGRPAYTESDVRGYTQELVGKPKMTPDGKPVMVNGKQAVYSLAEARQQAVSMLGGQEPPSGITVQMDQKSLTEAILRNGPGAAPAQAPAPAAQKRPSYSTAAPIRGGGGVYNGVRYPTYEAAIEAERRDQEAVRSRTPQGVVPRGLGSGTFGIE